jgi:hypothetical protein
MNIVRNKEPQMTAFTTWEDMTQLEQAQATFWDMYKDAHGFRPRHIDTSAWTIEQFEAELLKMSDENLVFKQRIQRRDEAKKKKVWVEEFIELPYNQIKEAKIVISFK